MLVIEIFKELQKETTTCKNLKNLPTFNGTQNGTQNRGRNTSEEQLYP